MTVLSAEQNSAGLRQSYPHTNVTQFGRKKFPGMYSIERVFGDINSALSVNFSLKSKKCRFVSKGLFRRFLNGLDAFLNKNEVNHVIGDVHYLALFLPRSRTIVTVHDCDMVNRASGLKRLLLKWFWFDLPLMGGVRIVAISPQTRSDIARITGVDESRIRVIPNPVSPIFMVDAGRKEPDVVRILQIGTKENKNLRNLIRAMEGLDVKLDIVGKLQRDHLRLLDEFSVDFTNHVDITDRELLELYLSCTFLSFISFSEGFGLPIVEAQAAGLPVLTSNLEPMLGVAGAGGALFVDPHDVSAIRHQLKRLAEDPELRLQLSSAGRENASRYTPGTIAELYADLYTEVAQHGARSA